MNFQNQVQAPRINYEPYIRRRTVYSQQQKEDAIARLNQGIPLRTVCQLAGPNCHRSLPYQWRAAKIQREINDAAQRRQQILQARAQAREQLFDFGGFLLNTVRQSIFWFFLLFSIIHTIDRTFHLLYYTYECIDYVLSGDRNKELSFKMSLGDVLFHIVIILLFLRNTRILFRQLRAMGF